MTTEPLIEHIKQQVDPRPEDLHLFTSKFREVVVTKGKFLLQPDTHVKHEYFVVKGCLSAYYLDKKGNKSIVQFAIENWWLGDFDAFYNGVPSKLYIEALEDSTLLAINYNDLQTLFQQSPIFERYFRILVTSAFISLRKRILSSLGKSIKERYLEFCESYPNIEGRVPNYQIASYLGVSPEGLSRARRKMKALKKS
ncbi:Crp/Fnr family transcriptional regulator [Flagellimonas lutimaris]|uniref:Crp/Fnr family transcriptional regulator n=1 Tax=Flagellimonas lutimaris TaxID=475082 RepID=A0A3A1N4I3_9FLAO|nr:Crp/Fnr family transcriptional regulator [Allomuricauda lutimaris]RIV30771.1 Crp/Fnr family transcriptional regulator [Allomuricauda lutimaris]